MKVADLPTGWGAPGKVIFHLFRKGSAKSLCGAWIDYIGPRFQDPGDSKFCENCIEKGEAFLK